MAQQQNNQTQKISSGQSINEISYSRMVAEIDDQDQQSSSKKSSILQINPMEELLVEKMEVKSSKNNVLQQEMLTSNFDHTEYKIMYSIIQHDKSGLKNVEAQKLLTKSNEPHKMSEIANKQIYISEKRSIFRLNRNELGSIIENQLENKRSDQQMSSCIQDKSDGIYLFQNGQNKQKNQIQTVKGSNISQQTQKRQNFKIKKTNLSIQLSSAEDLKDQEAEIVGAKKCKEVVHPQSEQPMHRLLSTSETLNNRIKKKQLLGKQEKKQSKEIIMQQNFNIIDKITALETKVKEIGEKQKSIRQSKVNNSHSKSSNHNSKKDSRKQIKYQDFSFHLAKPIEQEIIISSQHSKRSLGPKLLIQKVNLHQNFQQKEHLKNDWSIQSYSQKSHITFFQLEELIWLKQWNCFPVIMEYPKEKLMNLLKQFLKKLKINGKIEKIIKSSFIYAQISGKKMLSISYSLKIYYGSYTIKQNTFIKNGYGIEIDPKISAYFGHFNDGIKSGNGKIVVVGKYNYTGEWRNGVIEGKGKLKTQEGSIYFGHFVDGKRQGFGQQKIGNGDQYQGEYQNNLFDGKGVYIWKNGSTYKGQFSKGKMNGGGKWYSSKGDIYQGSYKNGEKHGYGTYICKNGYKYSGLFNEGKASQKKSTTRSQSQHKKNNSCEKYRVYFN